MKLAYFPGCAATGTGRELNSSTLAACQAYGVELAEIPNWVCCGASAAHMTHPNLARALPAVSLAKAAPMDVEGVLTACAACYNRLRLVELECKESDAARQEIEALPLSIASRAEERLALTQAIMALAPKHREIVLLYYYQDMSLRACAQVLGISAPTATRRLQQAQKKLRIQLEERG